MSEQDPTTSTPNAGDAPAFPSVYACRIGRDVRRGDFIEKDLLSDGGMSLRAYMATAFTAAFIAEGTALGTLAAGCTETDATKRRHRVCEGIATCGMELADALLAKLAAPQPAAVAVNAEVVAELKRAAAKAAGFLEASRSQLAGTAVAAIADQVRDELTAALARVTTP